MDDQLKDILIGLETIFESNLIYDLRQTLQKFPNIDLSKALSRQQILSKKWLITELSKLAKLSQTILIVGGWYGTLATLLLTENKFKKTVVRSIDIDPACADIADTLNRTYVKNDWQFKATTADMFNIAYRQTKLMVKRADCSQCQISFDADTIINTSCEHIPNLSEWLKLIPPGLTLVLQSNNFFNNSQHCNCVSNLDEFLKQANLTKIIYSGELALTDYTRYMIIGEK